MDIHLRKSPLLALITFGATSAALANTPLLENTDFSILDGPDVAWVSGANSYVNGAWQNFLSFEIDDRVDPSGSGFVFSSIDDGFSDRLENFLYQEYGASPTNTEFSTGDVIVFKGRARATLTGADTSDLVVRAMIKTLGWGDVGNGFVDPNQPKPEYSAFQPISTTLSDFELRMTFPDLTVDDSPTKVQIGFEIANAYDVGAGTMDMATIYFEDIEAYIEGSAPEMWGGYEVQTDGTVKWVVTDNLGTLDVTNAMADSTNDWVYSYRLRKWVYLAREWAAPSTGTWLYVSN